MIERLLDRLFDKRVIVNCDKDPYLIRWFVIRRKYLAIYIHKFIRSDEDRALHDHPWDFLVIPIWRGYYEHTEVQEESMVYQMINDAIGATERRRVLPLLGTRFRRATYRHRVELLRTGIGEYKNVPDHSGFYQESPYFRVVREELPAWSLFIRFEKFREWGFWEPNGFIQWNKWWQEKCE